MKTHERFPPKQVKKWAEQLGSALDYCIIKASNGHFFIEDLHSANKTYLNGKIVDEKKEFTPGSVIKIGRLEMVVDVVKKG